MRLIKKYESFFDADMAVVEIGRKFNAEKVRQMISEEMSEWSDDYETNGNGEAEEHVIGALVSWYERSAGKKLDGQQSASLEDAIRAHYKI